ncbi:MAG: BPSS1780 family membrane protein [Burkholderiaceae bacterium]|nr:hypothetical protein [Burkholderiaceae bacterium]MCZ8176767.1 BPSS1780 family membrane protein [Burkholderiaceae bacterium]
MPLILKSVEPARGLRWIGDAWRVFRKRPLGFMGLFGVFLFAALLVSLVPLVGPVVQMMSLPLMGLGFMIAAQSALLDGPVHPRCFIEPLRTDATRRRTLLTLCAMYGFFLLVILAVGDWMAGGAWGRLQEALGKGPAGQAQVDAILAEPGVGSGALFVALAGTLLTVPFWHAPALVHWGGQAVGQSLFSSTLAVWRAKGAFVVYLLGWLGSVMVFALGSALLLGLLGQPQWAGLIGIPAGLVLSAVFYVSLLFTFNDSFGGSPVQAEATAPTQADDAG